MTGSIAAAGDSTISPSSLVTVARNADKAPVPSDSVEENPEFSSSATQLVALEQGLDILPAFDEARVASAAAAISSGTYRVVFGDIADRQSMRD
jgi:anti-sigma28 factor (negative regulator of flagellin synthesis)